MQDAAIHNLDLGDGNSLFAVFDGHGDYKAALQQAFKRIDQRIDSPQGSKQLKKLKCEGGQTLQDVCAGTGCTANVVLVTPTSYFVANAGDSRSVLCRGGKAISLSQDHKPQSPEQQRRIRKAGGYIQMGRVNGGLNLTRSFGDFGYKRNGNLKYDQQMITCKPDIKTVQRSSQDQYIVLGCDGIWQRYVEDSQGLINLVSQQIKAKKANKKIVQELLDYLLAKDTSMGIGCDNMTAILVRFNQEKK